MKSRFDSIIAAVIISIFIGAGLTGAYALNDTSGIPSTGNGNGAPIAVASPDPTITVDGTEEVITELPATGWHSTGATACDSWGRVMVRYQWFVYSGYHYSVGAPQYSWQYTGRWC
jgi:hypothetical protein